MAQKASYTPNYAADPYVGGKDGGKANAQKASVPSAVLNGTYEQVAPPAMPGILKIGENKNVSTPVSG